MKNFIALAIFVSGFAVSSKSMATESMEPPMAELYHADNINIRNWETFSTHGTSVVVEFNPGDSLPLELYFKGALLESMPTEFDLHAKKRFFLKFSNGLIYYSTQDANYVPVNQVLKFKVKAGSMDNRLLVNLEVN